MKNKRITNKRTEWIGSLAILFLVASLATALHGCTDESDAASATDELQITVTDSSYRPADAPRSSEAGYAARATTDADYQTTFTDGDKIGLYSTKGNALVAENVCLTMKSGVWVRSDDKPLFRQEAERFFVYFPYRDSPGTVNATATTSEAFFGSWNTNWISATDQSTPANYSAQDLMLGGGTLEGRNLTVTLAHQMALVVIELPAGPLEPTFSGFKPFQVGNEYRYLIPSEEETKIEGTYTNGTGTHEYTFNANIPLGMYKKFGFAPVSMSYKIDLTGQANKTYTLPFKESGTISGYFLKVDWGDGTVNKIADGTNLSTPITHDYGASATGEKTIIIYSSQGDYSNEQVPGFKPGLYRIDYDNNLKLKQLLTPLLNTGETSFENCFYYCYYLTGSIPAGLFANNPQVTNFEGCFYNCSGLTGTIPVELFANHPQVTTFRMCFNECSGLTSIPEGLFAKNPQVTNFGFCFSSCSSLTSIPVELFAKNPQVTNFGGCFNECSGLTSIPEGLFAKNPQVTDFTNCFRSCSSLTSIPAGLFAKNPQVTNFTNCFYECKGLKGSIPAGLFANNTKVRNFNSCFYYCKGLTGSIPAELFANNTQVTGFVYCFALCSGLTGSIPAELFANNPQVTSFFSFFRECSGLTGSIPAELFANNPQVTDFMACFQSCTKLTLNKNIFCNEDTDKTTRFAGKNVDFTRCFQGVGSDPSVSANAGTVPALWDYTGSFTETSCYSDIGTVTNKADIPKAWGGTKTP